MSGESGRVRLAAVIVNYNAGPSLTAAVRSLERDSAVAWETVVVDNASTDGSLDELQRACPGVRTILNVDNVGFGRAVNQGVAATHAAAILIMNPDCEIETGAASRLHRALTEDDTVAIVGPQVLNPDGQPQGNARGDPDMLTGVFGRTSILQRLWPRVGLAKRNVVSVEHRSEGAGVEVDWLSGACMVVRREAFERVGGFDERYFLYWEDADLCRRLRHAGYRILYVPEVRAVHQVGGSSRTAPVASVRAFHRSAYLYYSTHVAPDPRSPKRIVAWVLLRARCWWKTARSRHSMSARPVGRT